MRASVLRVRAEHADKVVDRLLPEAPLGIYERKVGPYVELTLLGAELPDAQAREFPDDPDARLALLLDAPVVADRFVIRPPAAPPPDPALIDLVIDRGNAFGTGLHPTTRRCLELLLALEPHGSFADLGCGTGVLAIGAAKLGWAPVVAVDYDEASVAAAAHNAERNGVAVDARRSDLLAEAPPSAATVVANMPPHVQDAVRRALPVRPRNVVLSGIKPADADALVSAYAPLGLVERRRFVDSDWAAVLLTEPDVELRTLTPARVRVRVPAGGVSLVSPPETPLPATIPGQLETPLPNGGFALSSSRELPTGARVAVLLAPGLFRLDVHHLEDTLKVSLRNLSGSPIRQLPESGPPRTIVTTSELTIDHPRTTNSRLRLRVGELDAELILSATSGEGAGRIVAQAIVRPGETPEHPVS